jgi:hypothetical protein
MLRDMLISAAVTLIAIAPMAVAAWFEKREVAARAASED